MFRSFLFANSFIIGSLISIGKVLTVLLVICLFINPGTVEAIPSELRTIVGVFAIVCAGFGLASCCFGMSRVLMVAGFWVIAIYSLSSVFLGASTSFIPKKLFAKSAAPPPQVLPGGLLYEEIPDNLGHIIDARMPLSIPSKLSIPSTQGIIDAFSSYVSKPVAATAEDLNFSDFGLGDVGFGDMSFNSGVLSDSAYFAKPREKKSYYPISSLKKDSGLEGIWNSLLPK